MSQAPYFTEADQAWINDWVQHVSEQVIERELPQEGTLRFDVVASEGRMIMRKSGGTFGSAMVWYGMEDTFNLAKVREIFWRTKDGSHLKEWIERCSGAIVTGKEPILSLPNVLIKLWINLANDEPVLRGTIRCGTHKEHGKWSTDVNYTFQSGDGEEPEIDFLA
jgi:hypothetical protein